VRLFGKLTLPDAILPLIFLTLAQFESLVITPMPAHGAMPLLLVVLIVLSWTIEQPLARYTAITLLNVFAIYTGFGLFMGAITPVLLMIDIYHQSPRSDTRQWQWALVALFLSLAFVYAFSIDYRPGAAIDGITVPMVV
jgi:hypothetical protein